MMKSKLLPLLLLAAVALPASATVVLNFQVGVCFNSSSVAVPDGTLWAIIGDTNASSSFTGGFTTNASLASAGASQAFTTGQTLAVGQVLGGDTILAMGGFTGAADTGFTGLAVGALTLTLGQNGAVAGQDFAFYWFPGKTYSSGGNNTVGTQVGGINSLIPDAVAGTDPMVIPADGNTTAPGAANSDLSGTIPNSRFAAVNLVPESSTALLGALGALGLLRRRRI